MAPPRGAKLYQRRTRGGGCRLQRAEGDQAGAVDVGRAGQTIVAGDHDQPGAREQGTDRASPTASWPERAETRSRGLTGSVGSTDGCTPRARSHPASTASGRQAGRSRWQAQEEAASAAAWSQPTIRFRR
jgi:hypothetical protein